MEPATRSNHVGSPPRRGLHRRQFVVRTGTAGIAVLAGCGDGPSSGGPPYESHEIDGGGVYGPGLQTVAGRDYYADLVTSEAGRQRFELERLAGPDRAFLDATDFGEAYLGVIQVSGVPATHRYRVPDVSESAVNLTVVAVLEGETPVETDPVIATLLVRVTRTKQTTPSSIRVELDVGGRHELFGSD